MSASASTNACETRDSGAVIVVVGELRLWARGGISLPTLAGVSFLEFAELEGYLAFNAAPAVILSPLSGRGPDAVEIARLLHKVQFSGVYYAVTTPLPDPGLIRTEIERIAPGVVFDLLFPDDLAFLSRGKPS